MHVAVEANAGIGGCSILFLAENGLLTTDVAEQARAGHVLLVGDSDGFAAAGGMVQFSLRDNKLKLVVNLAPVKSAHLTLSSKLLRMAELIE
ncbi:YfiR family protein [Methylomonas koyamae]|uniref:YfiR family protein n=1 Tax=Methylomonas koyamae TaxID=702114 RepID=UPI00210FA253|nr:YfiR family protein [Methylomonas koyamae]